MKYVVKCVWMVILVLVDILLHAMGSHASTSTQAYIFLGSVGITRLLILSGAFGLVWDTVLFRFGLIGVLCNSLLPFVILFPLSTGLSVTTAAIRGAIFDAGGRRDMFYRTLGLRALYFFDYIGCLACYGAIFQTILTLSKGKFYETSNWIGPNKFR
ncbi:hypothetical protein AAMO2058_000550800 [Amorphochlora amoebiformis]